MIELRNTKKYEMIAGRIEQMIVDSDMKPGDRMLSIQKLYRHFGAAPATVCNALDLLRERGIVVSIPQKGTFVNKVPAIMEENAGDLHDDDIVDYLESALPMDPFFVPSRKTVTFRLKEYSSTPRRRMWDDIFQAFRKQHPHIDIEVRADNDERGDGDVVMYTDNLAAEHIAESAPLRAFLDSDTIPDDYFPIARGSLSGNQRLAKPFAVSQAWRVCNRTQLEKHCPGLKSEDFRHLISNVSERYDFSAESFPVIGTFVQFLPLNLIEEGVFGGGGGGRLDFSAPGVKDILEFNRCMVDKTRKYHPRASELSIGLLWTDFMKNRLMVLDTFSYILRLLTESRRDDFVVRPSPASANGHAVTRIQLLGVAADSPNAEEAVEFVRFACGTEGQRILAESQCNIPALRNCAEHGAFLNGAPEGVGAELLKHLDQERSLLNMPLFADDDGFGRVNSVLSSYYYGKLELDAAVRKLNRIRLG
jgi:DNA-binding transcriptional regulator YhcF (GntR family)